MAKQRDLPMNRLDALYDKVTSHINEARQAIHYAVDVEMVKAYWDKATLFL